MEDWLKCQIRLLVKYRQNQIRRFCTRHWLDTPMYLPTKMLKSFLFPTSLGYVNDAEANNPFNIFKF